MICIHREGMRIRNTQCKFFMQSAIRLCTRDILSFVGKYIHDTCRDESSPLCRRVSDTSRLRCGPPSAVWYSLVCMSLWLSTCPYCTCLLYFATSFDALTLSSSSLRVLFAGGLAWRPPCPVPFWLTDWLQFFVSRSVLSGLREEHSALCFSQSCIRITGRALSSLFLSELYPDYGKSTQLFVSFRVVSGLREVHSALCFSQSCI